MNDDQVIEQIESSDPATPNAGASNRSPEGELIFGLINAINQAYVAGLAFGALKR